MVTPRGKEHHDVSMTRQRNLPPTNANKVDANLKYPAEQMLIDANYMLLFLQMSLEAQYVSRPTACVNVGTTTRARSAGRNGDVLPCN